MLLVETKECLLRCCKSICLTL